MCLAFLMGCWACSSENDLDKPDTGSGQEQEKTGGESNQKEQQNVTWTPDSAAKYRVAKMTITTENGKAITSKEKKNAVNCTISIQADTAAWCVNNLKGTIRGRGNSTWEWYDKKPYRIKLDEKTELMGLDTDKDWVLLANYRDPTNLMNTYAFELGRVLDMPFTNRSRFVEVTLNGDYIGLYQLTEQVEQGSGRVDVADDGGVLISLDVDDGPENSPTATDNFWSSVYYLPVCVKYPDKNPNLTSIKSDLAKLEKAIQNGDYDQVKQLLDVESFINFLLIQEIVYNVELDAPRSMYMYHDANGDKWHMGPLWDFDGGYDFDWSNMYTGHKYFTNYKELMLGTSPAYHWGASYQINGFFSDLFKVSQFVSDFQKQWKVVSAAMTDAWTRTNRYAVQGAEAMKRDNTRWPIGYSASSEITRMKNWLNNRQVYLDNVISNY